MRSRNMILGVSALMALTPTILAGSLDYNALSAYMDWEPNCYKPSEPFFSVYDASSYNFAVDEYNYYLTEVEIYLDCIQHEAEVDIDLARRAIVNGYENKQSEVLTELESARFNLENARMFLE